MGNDWRRVALLRCERVAYVVALVVAVVVGVLGAHDARAVPIEDGGYVFCASEGASCSNPEPGVGPAMVRYGLGEDWVTFSRGVYSGVSCAVGDGVNDGFTPDPAPGQTKACYVLPPSVGAGEVGCSGGGCGAGGGDGSEVMSDSDSLNALAIGMLVLIGGIGYIGGRLR